MQLAVLGLVLLILIVAPSNAYSEFVVNSVKITIDSNNLVVNTELNLTINQEIENALNKGIPLTLIHEYTLYRKRPFMWDKRVQHWRYKINIRYHALSGRYIVSGDTQSSLQSFLSTEAALQYMGNTELLRLPLLNINSEQLDDNFLLAFRVRLDIESLPAPLRPVAYTSTEWRLNSPWTQWTIQN